MSLILQQADICSDAAIDLMFARKMTVGDGTPSSGLLIRSVRGDDILDNVGLQSSIRR